MTPSLVNRVTECMQPYVYSYSEVYDLLSESKRLLVCLCTAVQVADDMITIKNVTALYMDHVHLVLSLYLYYQEK